MLKLIGILVWFPELMQRIFKQNGIQNSFFTPDNELNILIY